jgi:hypothetical protein
MAHATHGHCKSGNSTRTYRIWANIRTRCGKRGWLRYSGNGITVCERWESFANFLEDVGEIPDHMTLDRIDNSKGYDPSNVRLATAKDQARNRTSNSLITIGGVTKPHWQWCEEHGISWTTLHTRIYALGWAEQDWLKPARSYSRAALPDAPSRTRAYRIWHSIRNRCGELGCERYVANGIGLCDRWMDFANFFADIGEIPPGMSLDRIDNAKGYEPGNVRLASAKQQARNRTTNRLVTIDGVTKTLADWSEEHGLPKHMLRQRVEAGWPEKDLLLPKGATQEVMLTIGDRTMNLSAWAKEAGISKTAFNNRLKRGWPLEKCLLPGDQGRRVL